MASLKIDTLKQVLKGGVRSNLFEIQINSAPALVVPDPSKLSILCRAGQIPAASLAPIEVPFRGARYKLPGDRTFEPWTVTIYNDPDMVYRGLFENWTNSMKGFVSNVAAADFTEYTCAIEVRQLNQQGNVIGTPWVLQDAWPSDITAIDLSSDNENSVSDFSVTFQYQYWTHLSAPTDSPNSQ